MKSIAKILVVFVFTIVSTLFIDATRVNYIVEKFIFSASSIMVGLSIALVGISMGNINSLYMSLLDIFNRVKSIDDNEKKAIINKLDRIKKELKDNITFTFIGFVFIILLLFFKETNLPYIKWPIDTNILTKNYACNILIISINYLIILAVYDSVKGSFNLSEALRLTKQQNND